MEAPRQGRALFWLCWSIYFITCMGRYNYAAVMGAITSEGILSLPEAGAVSTGFFLCFAVGQLVSGPLCQKVSPYGMIFTGLLLSGLCNLSMAVVPPAAMAVLWALNGLSQATIWPPIIRLFAECLPIAQQKRACVDIDTTIPAGTLATYGICAAILAAASWRAAFRFCGYALLAAAVLWLAMTTPLRRAAANGTHAPQAPGENAGPAKKNGVLKWLIPSGLLWLALPILLHGGLKDSVSSWAPSMIQSNFAVSPAFSSAVSMVLPVVNISGAYAADWLDRRIFHNEVKTVAALFTTAIVCLCLLPAAFRCNLIASVILLALVTASMLGANTLFANVMPVRAGSSGGAARFDPFPMRKRVPCPPDCGRRTSAGFTAKANTPRSRGSPRRGRRPPAGKSRP